MRLKKKSEIKKKYEIKDTYINTIRRQRIVAVFQNRLHLVCWNDAVKRG
jgi:aminopeptidase-like protein